MNVGLLFVLLMAIGIGVGTYGIYNFTSKRYSMLSYVAGVSMVLPLLLVTFTDELMALSLVVVVFGSVLYIWNWVCYGCTVLIYGSVLKEEKNSLDFNVKRARA